MCMNENQEKKVSYRFPVEESDCRVLVVDGATIQRQELK